MDKRLLILGCADRKRESDGPLPALDRYDGPSYRVLRKFLRDYQWPEDMSVAVLSAQHGLFGVLKGIEDYNKRMDPATARAQASECSRILRKWASSHRSVHVSLGKDYMPAVQPGLEMLELEQEVFDGPIGQKLHQLKTFLANGSPPRRVRAEVEGGTGSYKYFLPDWDDLLDPLFDFKKDSFSGDSPSQRKDEHCCVLMQPNRMSDGILVSLAQRRTQKGPLRQLEGTEPGALSPPPLRKHFGLSDDQYLFGDCGAFSYVNEVKPTISVEHAVALYEAYGFDFGASVDHMPVPWIKKNGNPIALSRMERQHRVDTTRENAERFINLARQRRVGFIPVGTIQALTAEAYAQSVCEYYEFGYRHLAIGGLVPRHDKEIAEIVRTVMQVVASLAERPWVHLFGVYRPNLQSIFRQLRVDSFDSATYFRKAWLRSDQNYLSVDRSWYAAIRVPMTRDGRTRQRLSLMGEDIAELEAEERHALDLLCKYGREECGVEEVLDAVLSYDAHLERSSDIKSMREQYRRTLEDRPWSKCTCNFCKGPDGIHMLIFRGANRNKRRGAHNTLMLYNNIQEMGIGVGDD